MRRLTVAALALAVAAAPGCRRANPRVDTFEEGNAPPRAAIRMIDPGVDAQLLSGFHPADQPDWRWTARKFSVALGKPPGAAQKGARLNLTLVLAESLMSRRRTVTLEAAVESSPLAPETYSKPGDYIYSRDVPASVFGPGPVRADFALDQYLAAGEVEGRELGLIVKAVELAPK